MRTTGRLENSRPWLEGKRVFLRQPRPEDGTEFTALNRASVRFHRGLVAPPRTLRQFADYLKRRQTMNSEMLFVCRTEGGEIVGAINFNQILRGHFQNAFLGYFMGASFAGRGYMTEALPLALRHAFRHLKLHRVEANLQPGNAASRALVNRAGFRYEGYAPRYLKVDGRWRDHERWAMTVEDWRALRRTS